MTTVAVLARSLLAVAFLLSAASKLLDRDGSREAASGLGVPERFARPVGLGLPVVELAAAGLLLPGATARLGLVVSGLLLVAFTALLIGNLVKGRRPTCRCFGQLSDEPISWLTVARNVVLLGLVVLGSLGGSPTGVLAWLEARDPTVLAVVCVLLAVVAVAAIASTSRLRKPEVEAPAPAPAAPELREGDLAPAFTLPDLDGNLRSLDDMVGGDRSLLLVFSDPGCGPCNELVPQLEVWRAHHSSHMSVVYLSSGVEDAIRTKADDYGLDPSATLPLGGDFAVPDRYGFRGTPSAALIGPDGRLVGPVAAGGEEIADLLQQAEQHQPVRTEPAELVIGDPAPPFHLHAIDGAHVDSGALHGRMTLFVFWDPTCSFCGMFLDDFRALQDRVEATGMHVVVVSSGDGGVAERSLPWPYVVDPNRALALDMGAAGTPMARLVDAEGRIASEVAAGADEIIALVDRMAFLSGVAAGVGPSQTS